MTTPARLRRSGAGAIALLAMTGLAACGSDNSSGADTSSSSSTTTTATTPVSSGSAGGMSVADLGKTSLSIAVRPKAGAAAATKTLTCNPAGGTVSNPTAACEQLAAAGGAKAFTLKSGQVCTQQIAGPTQATVTGTVSGQQVKAELSQTDGCRISQWNSLTELLGSRAGS